MQEPPDAANLLATARAVMLDRILPALPPVLQLDARMVVRAMEVAARLGVDAATSQCAPGLAAGIRAGLHDHAATLAALRADARARLVVSNPRALRE